MSGFQNPSDDEIRTILACACTVAVVGCSADPARDSHRIARFLQGLGNRIIPVTPHASEILGERCYGSLREIAGEVDMVDVFRRPEAVVEIAEDAIAIGAKTLWLQLGVVHEAAATRARAAGLTVVMDRCPAIEYRRLFGGAGR